MWRLGEITRREIPCSYRSQQNPILCAFPLQRLNDFSERSACEMLALTIRKQDSKKVIRIS